MLLLRKLFFASLDVSSHEDLLKSDPINVWNDLNIENRVTSLQL